MDVGDLAGLCPQCLVQVAFDSSVGAGESDTEAADLSVAPGDSDFGRYHIVRTLGEGGMGTVYLAEQRNPIRREVALKVVKLGMDTSQVLARFANERQALALMDHPNIARIFDAGATPHGRPYFVMEYIPGEAITNYCDGKRMTIRERLALFLAVCHAVRHAHQRGVIHRDLKPSNVLVMEHEGAPLPKVIDFGIAKATDHWAIEKTLLTQFGQMVGTPEYASPEQAEVMTGEVDERSDVYALGVLLYELLIGTAPFDAARLRQAGFNEMLRIIREEDAPPLSHRLTALGPAASEIAARRQTHPASLRRQVEGDLTSIAMKALDKARERRYTSAADLAADIQRYLEHRPALASPPSPVYRARKFLRRHRPVAFGTAAAFAVIASTGVTIWSLARRDASPTLALTDKDTIVLADFENKTGDPVFDDTLRQGLAVELQQSPFLSLVSDTRVHETLALMGQPKEARLTPEIAQQICVRTGSAATLEGSIASLGSEYVLGLRARNCSTGGILDQQQIQAPKREDVLNALSSIARAFRTRSGESLATVERYSTPLVQATTASLEALKAYITGRTVTFAGDRSGGIFFLQRAVAIDPQFAMAHAFLGFNYSNLGESELAAEYTTKAWQLRERASDRERFFIDFTYDRQVTGNLEKAYQTLEAWLQAYPRGTINSDPAANAQGLLGGLATHGTGRWQRAIEAIEKEVELNPDFPIAYSRVVNTNLLLDRLPEAERGLQRAAQRKLEMPNFLAFRYTIGVMKGDQEQMSRAIAEAQGKRLAEHWVAHLEALTLARSGRLQAARRSSTRAVDLAQQEGDRELAAKYQAARAVWEAACGNAAEGKKYAISALERSKGRDVEFTAALAHGLSGGFPQSEALADDLDKRFPEDTFAKFTHVPVLRGLAALRRGKPVESVELLQTALRYELAVNGLNFPQFYLGGLYAAHVRGEAFMAMRRHAEAAAEFQKILNHRGLVGLDPIGSLAHLQLGRALAMSGDTAKAKAAYDQFLALWRDADSDVPILKRAKAEYGRLQ